MFFLEPFQIHRIYYHLRENIMFFRTFSEVTEYDYILSAVFQCQHTSPQDIIILI